MSESRPGKRSPLTDRQLKRRLLVALTLAVLTILNLSAHAETLTVAGSTTFNSAVMVPHQQAIEAASGQKLVVIPNKTDIGVKLLLEKRADLAMISTSLDSILPVLRQSSPDLSFDQLRNVEIYRAQIAFTVHPSNRVRKLTAEELRRVLLGDITNWKSVGGADLPIRVVMVDSGAGIPLTLQTQFLDGKPVATKDAIRVRISSQVAKVVEQEPAALGLTQQNNLPGRNVVQLETEQRFEQTLSYVTLGIPSAAVRSVIESTRKILNSDQ
jgi:phosphate transport system substrate-binding protein